MAGAGGENKRTNGFSSDSLERGGFSARGEPAASDDESGTFANGAANSSATHANREPSADAAAPPRSGSNEKTPKTPKAGKNKQIEFPGPTDFAALRDGPSFADAVGEKVDLVAVSASLLQSGDEKIRKAELDRIREMKFGKVAASVTAVEEPGAVDLTGMPGPSI